MVCYISLLTIELNEKPAYYWGTPMPQSEMDTFVNIAINDPHKVEFLNK